MYIVFASFYLGQKTGEGSADVRWEEMAAVYNYFLRHPTHIFFGIGCPKKLVMMLEVGNVTLGDIGIVGGLLSNGSCRSSCNKFSILISNLCCL